ncbi:MAG: lysozyme [Deltaproteobacteria bacterium]|nr:lysozyme [Deltaproteobacteria bacterium]
MITRATTENGIELIKHFETFVDHVYICPAGYPTVGYGHVVREWEKERYAEGITEEEAEVLLQADLKRYEASVCRLITVPLDDGMYDALVSFTFNLGGGALQRSTLRSRLNREEYEGASDEFLKWVYAGGRKLNGLIRRRQTERYLFMWGMLLW